MRRRAKLPGKSIFVGVDIGSVFTKAVLRENSKPFVFEMVTSGGNYKEAAGKAVNQVLSGAGISLENVTGIVTTGVGVASAPFPSQQVSDVSCQARGVNYLLPGVRTVIDIGGQSSKVIKISPEGNAVDFVISERCAAGSGRFLQIISRILGIKIEEPFLLNQRQYLVLPRGPLRKIF
jgi:predicted CoA-substrate-specific enzyme activase